MNFPSLPTLVSPLPSSPPVKVVENNLPPLSEIRSLSKTKSGCLVLFTMKELIPQLHDLLLSYESQIQVTTTMNGLWQFPLKWDPSNLTTIVIILKNLCPYSEEVQIEIGKRNMDCLVWKILVEVEAQLSFASPTNQDSLILFIRSSIQMLSNVMSGRPMNHSDLSLALFDKELTLSRLLMFKDRQTSHALLVLICNNLAADSLWSHFLLNSPPVMETLLILIGSTDENGIFAEDSILYDLFEILIPSSPNLLQVYCKVNSSLIPSCITLLKLYKLYDQPLLHPVLIHLTSLFSFHLSSLLILNPSQTQLNSLTSLDFVEILFLILEILSQESQRLNEIRKEDLVRLELISNLFLLLGWCQKYFPKKSLKEGPSTFHHLEDLKDSKESKDLKDLKDSETTTSTTHSEPREVSPENFSFLTSWIPLWESMTGIKTLLIMVLANLSHESSCLQKEVLKLKGFPLILSCTPIDDNHPYLREACIFCIRNLCSGSEEIQNLVRELEALGLSPETKSMLKETGFKGELGKEERKMTKIISSSSSFSPSPSPRIGSRT